MRLHLPALAWRKAIPSLFLVSVCLVFLVRVRAILIPFLIALLIAYLVHPLVEWGERQRVPRSTMILLVYMIAAFTLVALGVYGFPILVREIDVFAEAVPGYIRQLQELVRVSNQQYRRVPIPDGVRQVLDEAIVQAEGIVTGWARGAVQAILGIFSQTFNLVLAPVLAYYMVRDWNGLWPAVAGFIPVRWRPELISLWHEMDTVLMRFVRGHLLVAAIVGILTGIGLALLGVEFSLLLGIVAGVTELIPYFGPFIGAVPAFAIALLDSITLAVYVLILMFIVQQIESNVLSPKILGDSVGLHPLLVVFSLLSGGHLFGLLGMLLAVPVAAVLRVLIGYGYRRLFDPD